MEKEKITPECPDNEEKILLMSTKGITTSGIESNIRDIYGIKVSENTITRINKKFLPVVNKWQNRPLESTYAVLFMDAIYFHVHGKGQIVKKAVYIAIGIKTDGKKCFLGMWIDGNESAKFWLSVMNGMRNRGVEEILCASTDGLTGFTNAVKAVFPKTQIQQCIIHQILNTTRFISYKDIKALMTDLKKIYTAVDEQTALIELGLLDEKW